MSDEHVTGEMKARRNLARLNTVVSVIAGVVILANVVMLYSGRPVNRTMELATLAAVLVALVVHLVRWKAG
jgi:hypothetical protein